MKKEKQLNQNGQLTSDKPGSALINPSGKGEKRTSRNSKGSTNSTAKDPDLGAKHVTR